MQILYDTDALNKPIILSINSDLLNKTKSLKINLSATLEQVLITKLAKTEGSKWQKENQRAVQTDNDFVQENILFADKNRSFWRCFLNKAYRL